jgi:hypothetical protein
MPADLQSAEYFIRGTQIVIARGLRANAYLDDPPTVRELIADERGGLKNFNESLPPVPYIAMRHDERR